MTRPPDEIVVAASGERSAPQAPAYESLPPRAERAARHGPERCRITVIVEVVTPILGGSSQLREIDKVDVIRTATARGHLRFWWRALQAHESENAHELYRKESELWGRAASANEGGRSAVELCIAVAPEDTIDDGAVGMGEPGAYALWPARETPKTPLAHRRRPGTRFLLTLMAPRDRETEVSDAVRAWLVFGGYGSRTRRGLGSFHVVEDADHWLPATATREMCTRAFSRDIFATPGRAVSQTPWLAGASLVVGKPRPNATDAWHEALGWLREFRQGTGSGRPSRAREPGTGKLKPQRPSISNWPEADKVRRLTPGRWAHSPRHNATPAWPRAGFGLPIIGRFQSRARDESRMAEPGDFEICWRDDAGPQDRLASPLIVKALPLANGTFAPCALWLNRAYPDGKVCLKDRAGSVADFDLLVAPGDVPYFSALAGKTGLREAFLDWLSVTYSTTAVAP